MFKSINDFIVEWKTESESTEKVLMALTDDSLKQKVYQDGRSLGFIAWHVVITLIEMTSYTGIKVSGPDISDPVPEKAADILEAYRVSSKSLMESIQSSWTDSMLDDELNLYGETWKRAVLLRSLIMHQAHHRGQMTVLMRQAGLPVPGVYGPSKEEWGAFGMPAQA